MTAFETVLQALAATGSTPKGNERTRSARCPAHDDHNPSLSITRGTDRVLMMCHAGCDTDDVLAALKLTRADLFDEPRTSNGSGPATVEYPYVDEDGKVLFVVQRREPKSFRQYRISNGAKVWNLNGTRRVLYQLPAVLAAVREGRTVYVCEGEKDVAAVERAGAVATCNPGGAGKWRDEYAEALTGAPVVVVADRDEPGRAHAAQVAGSLAAVAASVQVLEPAVGKDVADHLAAGRTLDELTPMVMQSTGSTSGPVTLRMSEVEPERVEWLWRRYLAAGKVATLDGDPALGKSTLGLDCAARLSTGTPWPDGSPCPVAVTIIMSAEDGLADTIRPRLDAAGADTSKVFALTEIAYTVNGERRTRLPSLADLPPIEEAIVATGAKLLIVDVLMAYLGGATDSHKDQDVRQVLHGLAALAERTGCCVLLLRHLNKSGAGAAMYRGGGSIGIIGAARAGFVVAPDPDDDTRRILAPLKCNLAAMPDALAYRLVAAGEVARIQWEGTVAHTAGDILGRHEDDDERTERDEAAEWLVDHLTSKGGQAPAGAVITAAAKDGIAKTTLTRARQRAGVHSTKTAMQGGWLWSLDPREESTKGPKNPGFERPGSSVPSDPPVDSSAVLFPSPEPTCPACGFPVGTIGHEVQCEGATA